VAVTQSYSPRVLVRLSIGEYLTIPVSEFLPPGTDPRAVSLDGLTAMIRAHGMEPVGLGRMPLGQIVGTIGGAA
jgi:hypothetical protein